MYRLYVSGRAVWGGGTLLLPRQLMSSNKNFLVKGVFLFVCPSVVVSKIVLY